MNKKILNIAILTTTIGLFLLSLTTSAADADAEWIVQVNGAVDNPFSFTLTDLAAMPQTNVSATLLCEGAYVASGIWTGVKLNYLLEQAGIQQNASWIVFHAQDGYIISYPKASKNDAIIVAHSLNGEPLEETLRLVIPDANGEFWIAMITSITASMTPYQSPQQPTNPSPTTPPNQTSTPSPPEPSQNQTNTQPATPPTESPPLQPTDSSSSSTIPAEYGYPIILAAVASTTVAIGYIAYEHRKHANRNTDLPAQ